MPFEFDAKKYADASAHQKEWGGKLISELALVGNERILDLGCGEGALTGLLAELVPQGSVVGVDASAGMIRAAQCLAAANLRFVQMDINQLDLDAEFNVIFSNAALHWIRNHDLLLQNVFRHLRSGGTALFNFAGAGNCAEFFDLIRDVIGRPEYRGFFDGFEWPWFMPAIDEYQTLLSGHSFSEKKVWPENADRYFADARALAGWIDQPSIVPFISHLSQEAEADRRRFRDTVVNEMTIACRQRDGTYFVPFRRINVRLRK